jgi:hypothetical protein
VTATNPVGTSEPALAAAIPFPDVLLGSAVEIWLDAAATSAPGSGAVTTWASRGTDHPSAMVGGGSAGAPATPPLLGSLKGRPAVLFDGVHDQLETTAFVTPGAHTVFTAFANLYLAPPNNKSVGTLYATRECGQGAAGGSGFAAWGFNSFGGDVTTFSPGTESFQASDNAISIDGSGFTPVADGTGGQGPTTTVDSQTWSLVIETVTMKPAVATSVLDVGAFHTGCNPGHMAIGELIMLGSAASGADVTAVEGYLEHRWQVTP